MSIEALLWATSDAPIANVNEFAVLVMLAEKADPDGCAAFPSQQTVAARTTVDPKTVKRTLAALERRGLIGLGDQRAAQYLRADRRPKVYDLLIPYGWFPNIERINKERGQRGRPPLTPASRPPIQGAPEKARRSDAGKPRKRAEDTTERGDSQSPRAEGPVETHGGTVSPSRGDSQSGAGGLVVTRTSPLNLPLEPSTAPDARRASAGSRARARENGAAGRNSDSASGEGRGEGSGCAASEQKSPTAKKKPRHTREQLDLVRRVRAHFPQVLLQQLPEVPVLSDEILKALAGDVPGADRTVEQLGRRIMQRWVEHGHEDRWFDVGIKKPIGMAIAMVRPLKPTDRYGCANPRCDAGKDADDGSPCPVCPVRLAERAAQQQRENAQGLAGASDGPSGSEVPAPRLEEPYKPLPAVAVIPQRVCVNPECRQILPRGSDAELCHHCEADPAAAAGALDVDVLGQESALERMRSVVAESRTAHRGRVAYAPTAPF
ncbi:helix-turn-helix domain-containing protein [Streptomyces sp. NPDC060243]|uniref:helix-turn-helix domain-containing protein n=1 Tax=Streptomyces sp. NPDC060243 TaxID=3347081 RepID=UPI003658C879